MSELGERLTMCWRYWQEVIVYVELRYLFWQSVPEKINLPRRVLAALLSSARTCFVELGDYNQCAQVRASLDPVKTPRTAFFRRIYGTSKNPGPNSSCKYGPARKIFMGGP